MSSEAGGSAGSPKDSSPTLVGRRSAMVVPVVVASALFMDLLDSFALATALPTIAVQLRAEVVDLKLALTAYIVTVSVLVSASGWAAGRFGARRVFVGAIVLFVAGSICCGLSQSLPQLVAARVLQGAGGAMMTPVGRIIVVASAGPSQLVRAMAWYTLPAIMAPLLGPPLAGALIEFASWRWIFFINVPVSLFAILAVLRYVPRLETARRTRFDAVGFGLYGAAILAVMGLVETGVLEGSSTPLRWLGVAIAGLLCMLAVRHSRRSSAPLVDVSLMRYKTFRYSLLATWLQRIGLGAMMFLVPLQFQLGFGMSPLAAGKLLVAGALGSLVSRIVGPRLIRMFGFRSLMVGFSLITAGLVASHAGFSPSTPHAVIVAVLLTHAATRASFFLAGNTLAYSDIEVSEIGHASVLVSISQQLSIGLGINLGAALLKWGGGPPAPAAFTLPYLLLAMIPVVSLLAVYAMPAAAGHHIRGSGAASR